MKLRTSLFICSLGLSASTVFANESNNDVAPYFGAGVWARPAYLGADDKLVTAIPLLRYYGDTVFARTTQGVLEAGLQQKIGAGFTAGLQLAYEGGREIKESDFLKSKQVANLGVSASWGAHVEWDGNLGPAPANAILRYRQDAKSNRGAQVDLRGTVGVYGGETLKAGIFTQFTWANSKSAQTYYGNALAANALPSYNADSGLVSSSVGVLWSYDLASQWALQGSVERRALPSRLQSSPLTQANGNAYFSIGVTRQF